MNSVQNLNEWPRMTSGRAASILQKHNERTQCEGSPVKHQRKRRIAAGALATGLIAAFAALGGVGVAQSAISAVQYQYGHKVTICHKGKTITVSKNAVPAHVRNHQDTVGTCAAAAAKKAKAAKIKAAKIKAAKIKAAKAQAAKAKAEQAKAERSKSEAEADKPGKGRGRGK